MTQIAAIKEHMRVRGSDGGLVGVVDRLEGEDIIKLTRNDSPDDRHHFILAGLVERVDNEVHLSKPADQVMRSWDSHDENAASPKRPEQDDEHRVLEWADRRR